MKAPTPAITADEALNRDGSFQAGDARGSVHGEYADRRRYVAIGEGPLRRPAQEVVDMDDDDDLVVAVRKLSVVRNRMDIVNSDSTKDGGGDGHGDEGGDGLNIPES